MIPEPPLSNSSLTPPAQPVEPGPGRAAVGGRYLHRSLTRIGNFPEATATALQKMLGNIQTELAQVRLEISPALTLQVRRLFALGRMLQQSLRSAAPEDSKVEVELWMRYLAAKRALRWRNVTNAGRCSLAKVVDLRQLGDQGDAAKQAAWLKLRAAFHQADIEEAILRNQLADLLRLQRIQRRVRLAGTGKATVTAFAGSSPVVFPTASQQQLARQLEFLWRGRERLAALSPGPAKSWVPVLTGPSGAGKFLTLQLAAERLEAAVGRWSVPGWVMTPRGGTGRTVEAIADFVDRHARSIVYLSEVDALTQEREGQMASYLQAVQTELVDLLDYRVGGPKAERLAAAMASGRCLFVLGVHGPEIWGQPSAAARRVEADQWRERDREPLTDPEAIRHALFEGGTLPAALAVRVMADPLILPSPTRGEAHEVACRIAGRLDEISQVYFEPAEVAAAAARAGGRYLRVLTDCLQQALVRGVAADWHLAALPLG